MAKEELQRMVACIADGSDTAIALYVCGDVIEQLVEKDREVFIENWLVDIENMPQKGIWIWEGVIKIDNTGCRTFGEWRELEINEWATIAEQKNPWR